MRLWMGPIVALLFLCPWILGNSECNAFSGVANKSSDGALLFQARQQIDQANYAGALTTLSSMSAAAQAGHDGVLLAASAHVGICGLNLVQFGYDLANQLSAGTKLLPILLFEMRAATSSADCRTAESLMLGLPASSLTSDDYVFIAFLEFAKIGAELESSASASYDLNLDTTPHQGAVKAASVSCGLASTNATALQDLGFGLITAINALSASGSSIGGSVGSICTPLPVLCSATSAAAVSAKLVATILISSDLGFNTCGGTAGSGACICP
jgi:hypothetical protein